MGRSGLVTVALFVLAIAQAAYFALVAMGLGGETRTMRQLVAIPLVIAVLYALVLVADAVWRARRRVGGLDVSATVLQLWPARSAPRPAPRGWLWLLPLMFAVPYLVSAVNHPLRSPPGLSRTEVALTMHPSPSSRSSHAPNPLEAITLPHDASEHGLANRRDDPVHHRLRRASSWS